MRTTEFSGIFLPNLWLKYERTKRRGRPDRTTIFIKQKRHRLSHGLVIDEAFLLTGRRLRRRGISAIEGCSTLISALELPASASFNPSTKRFSCRPIPAPLGESFTVNFTIPDCASRKAPAAVRTLVIHADHNCQARGSGIAEVPVKRIDFNRTRVGDCSVAVTVAVTRKGGGALMICSVALVDENDFPIEGFDLLPAMLQLTRCWR